MATKDANSDRISMVSGSANKKVYFHEIWMKNIAVEAVVKQNRWESWFDYAQTTFWSLSWESLNIPIVIVWIKFHENALFLVIQTKLQLDMPI